MRFIAPFVLNCTLWTAFMSAGDRHYIYTKRLSAMDITNVCLFTASIFLLLCHGHSRYQCRRFSVLLYTTSAIFVFWEAHYYLRRQFEDICSTFITFCIAIEAVWAPASSRVFLAFKLAEKMLIKASCALRLAYLQHKIKQGKMAVGREKGGLVQSYYRADRHGTSSHF